MPFFSKYLKAKFKWDSLFLEKFEKKILHQIIDEERFSVIIYRRADATPDVSREHYI